MGSGCGQFAWQDSYSEASQAGKLALSSLVSIILICRSHEAVLPVKGGVKEVSRPKSQSQMENHRPNNTNVHFLKNTNVLGHTYASFLTSETCSRCCSRPWEPGVRLDQTVFASGCSPEMALYKQFVFPRKYSLFSFLLGYSCFIVLLCCCSTTKQISHMYTYIGGFPGGLGGKESTCIAGNHVLPLGGEDLLEKEMTTHSSMLAWRISWLKKPSELQSV